ncbi:MAG: hypothetical protein KY469_07305 [Actinobacteria bacterium]|nr:hypothetical protein [Actinomycetota bacterium]
MRTRLPAALTGLAALSVAFAPLGADTTAVPTPARSTAPSVASDHLAEEVPQDGLTDFPAPVDPESWELPEWQTWDDYTPIPGVDWNEPPRQPVKKIRAALLLGDFQDREFIVTEPEGSDLFGIDGVHNPIGVGDIPREEVGDWYADFLIREPSELNHGHTVNEYWLEDSYGLVGVDADAFGPYRMEGKEHEYGLSDVGGAGGSCPAGDSCNKNFDTELLEASLADTVTGMATNGGHDYDFRWLLHAGYDESGVWEEFGRMMFATPEEVTEEFGNPDESKPNWANTRYIDWTSFAAAKSIWSHAIPGVMSTQGESDGQSTFAHELSHIFGVLDNYNNPFGNPVRRSYSGPWDMLSRGTFNGPGGTHNRWQIPPNQGGSMGSHHMLRNKLRLGFMKPNEVLFLERDSLSRAGVIAVDIFPRAYPLAPITTDVGLHGIQIVLDRDESPSCSTAQQHDCDGGGYHNYTVEAVDRIGYDSFLTDRGVLIAKTKNADLAPFIWVKDSHPEDINARTGVGEHEGREIFDYITPTGEEFPISLGDYRQLADATFRAGTGEGVVDEYVDEANQLHFYVLDTTVGDDGVRTYRVAVRHLDDQSPFTRGVETATGQDGSATPGNVARVTFAVTNTGNGIDLFRLAAATTQGWQVQLQHDVVEVGIGETVEVPVFVRVPDGDEPPTADDLTLTVTSETGGQSATATARVTPTS